MSQLEQFFKVTYNRQQIHLETVTIKDQVLFHIIFSDNTKPLTIGRITNFEGLKVWSSFPEGRLKEAQEIGNLIIDYYLKNNK